MRISFVAAVRLSRSSRGRICQALLFTAAVLSSLPGPAAGAASQAFVWEGDLAIYGASASGVMAAIAARQNGVSVALVDPGRHVGGMVTGGLGKTDIGRRELLGGLAREFFERIGRHYGKRLDWFFEPHVAEQIMVETSRFLMSRSATVRSFTSKAVQAPGSPRACSSIAATRVIS
jgi:hypothetical protein